MATYTASAYEFAVNKLPERLEATPAISVVVPMFNSEEYIDECLESILNQTFQNFEVIIVDDCSTDNSVQIVESYAPKFNGRLRLTKTETNSGGGGYVPRNIGFKLARGEYVIFIDSDDFILLTALETLYDAAKQYDADVVYTSAYYRMQKLNDFILHRDGEGRKLLREGLQDEPTLTIDEPNKILSQLLLEEREGNFRNPWSKFIKRKLLTEHRIFFPTRMTTGGDFIWVINVYCHANRFLRLPTPFYFYRLNTASVTKKKREPSNQIFYWISEFVDFVKHLSALENENDVLRDNPAYCLAAFESHFNWCLNRTNEARNELSNQDVYAALRRKCADDSSDLTVPFFFSFIDNERKVSESRLKTIKQLEKERDQLKKFSAPAVSVIIPMYNAAKYIGECLDSLLAQTFQNFEVIVVDDCSTDNSVQIVESYAPKFNGRLYLTHTETNSGSGGVPRNKGISFSRGEYIQFLDADDILTKTALEEMYTLAKKNAADVVYCEQHYKMEADGTNREISIMQPKPWVDKPTVETANFAERVDKILKGRRNKQ